MKRTMESSIAKKIPNFGLTGVQNLVQNVRSRVKRGTNWQREKSPQWLASTTGIGDMIGVCLFFNLKNSFDRNHLTWILFPDFRSVIHQALDDYTGMCEDRDGNCWIYPYCIPQDFDVIDRFPWVIL